MIARFAYILIGDDLTGKTTFQKYILWHLCGVDRFAQLKTNLVWDVTHRNAPRKLRTLFTINRSVQEKMKDYGTLQNYFDSYFQDADVCILSSHAHPPCINDIEFMLQELQNRYYNVNVVFFSNHLNANTQQISRLSWQERILIDNPNNSDGWQTQIDRAAHQFVDMILKKSEFY